MIKNILSTILKNINILNANKNILNMNINILHLNLSLSQTRHIFNIVRLK